VDTLTACVSITFLFLLFFLLILFTNFPSYILSTRMPTLDLMFSQRCWQRSLLGYDAVSVPRRPVLPCILKLRIHKN
jgi:hypothetical protein